MKKKTWKHRLHRLLCVPLALLFTGCMAASVTGGPTGPLRKATADRLNQPTGRFVETDITPPNLQDLDIYPITVIPRIDGSVDYFVSLAGEEGGLRRYRTTDGGKSWNLLPMSWEKEAMKLLGRSGNPLRTRDIVEGPDGSLYFTAYGQDDTLRLLQVDVKGSLKEIPIPAWKEADYQNAAVDGIALLPSGNFAFTMLGAAGSTEIVDGKTYKVKSVIDDIFLSNCVYYDRQLAALTPSPNQKSIIPQLTFYDLSTGKQTRALNVPNGAESMCLAADGDSVYIASRKGIDRISKNGSLYETVMEGPGFTFTAQDSRIEKLVRQENGDFYMILYQDRAFSLRRYSYDPQAPAQPQEITVFSIEESGSLGRAAIAFQQENPGVMVRLQIGSQQSALSREQTIQALEKELKAGKGPDVLLLNGLDMKEYAARGWLTNLGSPEIITSCFQNPVNACVENGYRYAIPTRLILPLSIGEPNALRAGKDATDGVYTQDVEGTYDLDNLVMRAWFACQGKPLAAKSSSGVVFPAMPVGIPSGAQMEPALKFVEILLSDEVQKADFFEGLPIRKSAFTSVANQTLSSTYDMEFTTDLTALVETLKTGSVKTE